MTVPPPRHETLPGSFLSMTMGRAVRAMMQRDPDKLAILCGERSLSYGQLVMRFDRLRDRALTDLEVGRGDVVAIVARNCLEYFEVVLGIPESGAAVATIDPRLTPAEMKAVLDDCGARVIFADAPSLESLGAAGLHDNVRLIGFGPAYEEWLERADRPRHYPPVNEWDIWTIPYTSGTTGKPKGVMLPHRSRILVGLISASEFGCFGPDDRFLAITPMNHGGGLGFPAAALATGGTVDILDKFDPEQTLRKLKHGGITGIFMVPTHFQMIFDLPDEVLAKFRRPPLKTIISNAAPLAQAMKQRIVPYFGETVLHEIYGATESGLVSCLRPNRQLSTERSVGVPMAHIEVRILDERGQDCQTGQVGELFSRSPLQFAGYWNRPVETEQAFRQDWLSVGDMAVRDEQGLLYIVDRKKDLVISGGVNIYPREIEEALKHHPAIADVAVVGVPDPVWGEKLRAFVVKRPAAEFTYEEMASYLVGKLAAYKIPKELRLLDALPRNTNGKVLKTHLRGL